MNWLRNKRDEVLDAAMREVAELTSKLEQERSARLAAETINYARTQEIQRLIDQAQRFERLYTEAMKERLKSLDTVNVALLRGSAEENVPPIQNPSQQIDISPKRPKSPGAVLVDSAIRHRLKAQGIEPKKKSEPSVQ